MLYSSSSITVKFAFTFAGIPNDFFPISAGVPKRTFPFSESAVRAWGSRHRHPHVESTVRPRSPVPMGSSADARTVCNSQVSCLVLSSCARPRCLYPTVLSCRLHWTLTDCETFYLLEENTENRLSKCSHVLPCV